jgi:hypothetical protein
LEQKLIPCVILRDWGMLWRKTFHHQENILGEICSGKEFFVSAKNYHIEELFGEEFIHTRKKLGKTNFFFFVKQVHFSGIENFISQRFKMIAKK